MFAKEEFMKVIIEDGFVIMNAFITPLLLLFTTTDLRRQLVNIVIKKKNNVEEDEQELDMFDDEANDSLPPLDQTVTHRPDSAPTRPSSAALPGTIPSESGARRPYKSNIRIVSKYFNVIKHIMINFITLIMIYI